MQGTHILNLAWVFILSLVLMCPYFKASAIDLNTDDPGGYSESFIKTTHLLPRD